MAMSRCSRWLRREEAVEKGRTRDEKNDKLLYVLRVLLINEYEWSDHSG
jgi:hypothetical protein